MPALPERGANAIAASGRRYAASAVNVLLAAARSGAACVHAGSVGTGPNGDLIRAALGAAGVPVSSPQVPDLDTGTCVVLLEPSGERTFVTVQGAERRISRDSLASSAPRDGDLVCVSGYSLFGATRDALLAFLDALPPGVRVVLDPGAPYADLDEPTLTRSLARTGVWTGNRDEAAALARRANAEGEPGADLPALAEVIATLLPPDAAVVVRNGPAGCVVREAGVTSTCPGYPQRAVDTNGAGDVHTGVLVAELAAGAPLAQAAARGNAAGAIKVTRRGPDTAPTAAEIDAFLRDRTG